MPTVIYSLVLAAEKRFFGYTGTQWGAFFIGAVILVIAGMTWFLYDWMKKTWPHRAAMRRGALVIGIAGLAVFIFWEAWLLTGAFGSRVPVTERKELEHFYASMEIRAGCAEVMKKSLLGLDSKESMQRKVIIELERALGEARLVKDSALARVHPELPGHFRRLYQGSLETAIDAIRGWNTDRLMAADSQCETFEMWCRDNHIPFIRPKK
ncbi:MAG: hypothetical protein ACYS8W_09460 [Planctomycetota bacterium]|jgi:hypothetical protein